MSDERVPKFSPRDLNPIPDGIECLGSPRSGKLTCLVLREDGENLERRINEIGIYASQQILLEKYKYVRELKNVIEEDYHSFDPERHVNSQ